MLLSLTILIILTNSANAIFPLTCGEVTTPGVYTLSGHLTSDGSSGESGINPTACINITTNDVVLNCAGYRINYSSFNATEIGIATNSSNVTLQNCELGEGIDGFSAYSILVNNSGNEIQNITLYNVTVNGTEAIYLNNVTNANLTLVTVLPTSIPAIGIELGANGVYNSTLINIIGNSSVNGAKLIYAIRSNNVNITNFTGYVNAGGAATALTSQSNLTITNMTGSHYGNSGSVLKINDGTINLYNSALYGQFGSIPGALCSGGRLNSYNTIFNATGATAVDAQCSMTLEAINITYGNLTIGNASNITIYNSTLDVRNITTISESSSNLYVIQPLNVTTTNLDANVTVTNYSAQSLNTTTKSALFNITALRVNSTGTFNFSNVTINATNSTTTNQTYLILQAPYQGAYQTSTIALTVPDTTAPVITINLPVNNTNQTSATLTINFSVTDETALHSCWYSINKTTNVSVAGCANATTNQTTATITTGTNQNITIYANDTSGNLATKMYTFTRDTTAPQITAVTNSSTSSSGFTIAWTTNEPANSTLKYGDTTALLDGTSSNSENDTAHSRSASGLDSSTLYYYNVTSCDTSGNCNTTGPYTITTSAASSTSSSSGGGSSSSTTSSTNTTTSPTIALTIAENKVGTLPDFDSHKETRRAQIGDKGILLYTHQKEQHRIQVKKIETGKVTLTLASTPFDVTLATGEEKTYDVTGDKQDDIKLKLVSITGKNILLEITQYVPPKATTPTTVKTTTANTTNTNNTNTTDLAQNLTLPNASQLPLIPIAVVVIVIIAALAYWKTKTAAPKYPLARKPPGKKLF